MKRITLTTLGKYEYLIRKKSIEQGLQDLENGNVVSHKDVMIAVKNKIAAFKLQLHSLTFTNKLIPSLWEG